MIDIIFYIHPERLTFSLFEDLLGDMSLQEIGHVVPVGFSGYIGAMDLSGRQAIAVLDIIDRMPDAALIDLRAPKGTFTKLFGMPLTSRRARAFALMEGRAAGGRR